MNRFMKIEKIRMNLQAGQSSIGSWMQIPNSSVAEIMGQAGYDWVAIDLEHGAISVHQLPSLFRALELGDTLPLVRVAEGSKKDCQQAMDAGAGGIIVPLVESSDQLKIARDSSRWPPSGTRGVGFSRANLFGKNFSQNFSESQAPLLIAMIESSLGLENLDRILETEGLDAIFIGPYDLSASLGEPGNFEGDEFKEAVAHIKEKCKLMNIACGLHVVSPDPNEFQRRLGEGYRFVAYSIDSVFLNTFALNPYEKGHS
jgi:2-dehydro-3-deoxyglucarate aldolase